jgi:hypothetical protein
VGLLDRIRRPDDNAEGIAGIGPAVDAYTAGKLGKANLDFIARQLDEGQSPDGAVMANRKQALIDGVQPLIDQQAREGSLPAASQRLALERDIDSAIRQYRAEGKNPLDLLNAAKADYLGSPEALAPYVRNVAFQPIGAGGPAGSAEQFMANFVEPNDIRRSPPGRPPSPSDVWQRGLFRSHMELLRRAQDLADYLRGLFNHPADDKEPEKEKPRPQGEVTSPPNPGPDGLPPPPPGLPPRPNEPETAAPRSSTDPRLDRARISRDARQAEADRQARVRTATQARANARLSKEDSDWLDEDPTGRRDELAYDPAQKRFRMREARTAIEAEEQGLLPGPLHRAPESGNDIIDANNTPWDHTQATNAEGAMGQIEKKAYAPRGGSGKNTLADLQDLSPSDARKIAREWESRQHPPGTGRVIFVMPKEP